MQQQNVQHPIPNRYVFPVVDVPQIVRSQRKEFVTPLADRRKFPRFKVADELLCVSDYSAGQILDISPTGMAFQVVNFSLNSAKDSPIQPPLQCEKLSILHTGPLSFFIMKNLLVKESHDRTTGLLYPGNSNIRTYRRGVGFAVPLATTVFDSLQPYLAGGGDSWSVSKECECP